jgi:hypothetical protein
VDGSRPKKSVAGGFFLRVPDVFYLNTSISCGKCDFELAYKVSCLFLSDPANHKPSTRKLSNGCKYQPAYRRPNTKFFTVCRPYANLILILTNQGPLRTNKALAASRSSFIIVKIYSAFD